MLAAGLVLLLGSPAAASSGETSASKVRVFVAEPTLAGSVRDDMPELVESRLSPLIAQGVAGQGSFEALTPAEMEAVGAAKPDLLGTEAVASGMKQATAAGADLLLQAEIGQTGEQLMISATLTSLQEKRVVARVLTTAAGAEQARQELADLARRLLHPESSAAGDAAAHPGKGLPPGRTLVFVQAAGGGGELLDEPGRVALERRLAGAVAALEGRTAIAQREIADTLEGEELRRMLGEGSPDALAKLGKLGESRYLVPLSVGQVGGTVLVSASLIDTESAKVVTRGSLLLPDRAQLAGAAEVVTVGLFGELRALPPPPADESRFEKAMARLAIGVQRAYLDSSPSPLSRLAVLPLTDRGPEAKVRKLGAQAGTFLARRLRSEPSVKLVDDKRLQELAAAQELGNVADLPAQGRQELATFLGASAIVVGTVSDVGRDFLLQVEVLRMPSGEVLGGAHALFPMGEPGSLVTKALVTRTRSDALFRSVFPGWGQFYNGPEHAWKGYLISGGTVLAVGAAVATLVLAGDRDNEATLWGPGGDTRGSECGTLWETPGKEAEAAQCIEQADVKSKDLSAQADDMRLLGYSAIGAAAAFWLWGVVDTMIYAEDYSELSSVSLQLAPGLSSDSWAFTATYRF